MFGHATLYYGWLGGPLLLGILAYAFGSLHKVFLATLSETSLLAVYAFFCFFSYSYMAIPSDHYLAGSVITLAAWKIKDLVLSSNKS